jgi:glycosyltransferase involved in cell wall biosynthesis
MRILLVVHQFFPSHTAGTEVLTYSVARELIRRGHRVHILAGHPNNADLHDKNRFEEYNFEGIPISRFHHSYVPMGGQTSLLELSYDNRLAASYFKRIIYLFKPDIVHFFHFNRLGTGLIDEAVSAGIPAYFTPTDFWAICNTAQMALPSGKHCGGPSPYAGNCLKHLIQIKMGAMLAAISSFSPDICMESLGYLAKNHMLPSCKFEREAAALVRRLETNINRLNRLSGIVAPNTMMADLLVQFGVNPKLIIEEPYGVEISRSEINSPRRIARQPLRIGYIGTLAWHKGCHVLLKAFNSLPAGKAVLTIYGNPDDFPEYAAHLKVLAGHRQDVEFAGLFANDRIFEVLSEFDALVVPSLWHENTPLVVYSAQASSCPVIASNCPGIAGFIEDEKNGLLFTPGDAGSLSHQISRLIDHPELIGHLSTNAKQPKSTSAYVEELLSIWKAS